MQKFVGTGVALITPFAEDGTVDFDTLDRLVNFQIENGVEYIVALGTTAEAVTLTADELQAVRERIVKVNAGRVPLMIGMGGNNTALLVEKLKTTDLSGFDAVLSVSPYYNKPSQEGIYQHYKAVADASPLPVMLYNVPGRTAVNVMPETVFRLAEHENIFGLKEAAGDMEQAKQLIQGTPDDFIVVSGDDIIALPMTLEGGAGVISVLGQALPAELSEMVRLGLKGEAEAGYVIHNQITEAIDYIFEEGNPVGIKSMLAELGYGNGSVRLPLVKATASLRQKIAGFVKDFATVNN